MAMIYHRFAQVIAAKCLIIGERGFYAAKALQN